MEFLDIQKIKLNSCVGCFRLLCNIQQKDTIFSCNEILFRNSFSLSNLHSPLFTFNFPLSTFYYTLHFPVFNVKFKGKEKLVSAVAFFNHKITEFRLPFIFITFLAFFSIVIYLALHRVHN